MEVTMLRDKLNTGMRLRLDNLSISECVYIKSLIERDLKDEEEYFKTLDPNDKKFYEIMSENIPKKIASYKSMISAFENEKVVQLDCYRGDVEQESFATMVKKYKKIKE